MEKLKLKDIQQAALDVLIKIDEICKKLNLEYSLAIPNLVFCIFHQF